MFGYVKIKREELRVREYEYYRAAYCGLCRSMGKCTGQCSRFTLSYDIAFLSQVRMALCGTVPSFKKRRCIAHPVRARMMMEPNEQLCYAADVSAILSYEKCRDDVADKRGVGRLLARLLLWAAWPAYRRAKGRHGELAIRVREKLAELSALERARRASVDEPAAVFGDILSMLMAEGLPQNVGLVAREIGKKVGRFVYIIDAIDDASRDAKTGNFNPIVLLFGEDPKKEQRQLLEDALISCLDDAAAALDLVGEKNTPCRAILENILYLGMPSTAREILWRKAGKAAKEEDREQ